MVEQFIQINETVAGNINWLYWTKEGSADYLEAFMDFTISQDQVYWNSGYFQYELAFYDNASDKVSTFTCEVWGTDMLTSGGAYSNWVGSAADIRATREDSEFDMDNDEQALIHSLTGTSSQWVFNSDSNKVSSGEGSLLSECAGSRKLLGETASEFDLIELNTY